MCRVHAALAWHDAETRCVSATTGRARRGGGGDARVLCVARRHAAGCCCVSRVWLHINHQGRAHVTSGAWGLRQLSSRNSGG